MTHADPLRDAAARARTLAQHIRRDRVAADLAWVRWAAQHATAAGSTPADRQAIAACSRINRIVCDSPDATDPTTSTVAPLTRSRDHRVADLVQQARHWRTDTAEESPMQIIIPTHDAQIMRRDRANGTALVRADGSTPLLDVRGDANGPTVLAQAVRPVTGVVVKPLTEYRVAVRRDPARPAPPAEAA